MYDGMMVGVVIPARNEAEHLAEVLSTIPDFVDKVVVVDDGSTDGTGKLAVNVELVTLTGEGVGAAIDAGHRRMLELFDQEFVSVVIAGDGQMDPSDMEKLISPIIEGKAHHSKGERLDRAGKMPFYRRIGTFLLAILTTLACGQNISDPQCGYTATSSKVLKTWDWDRSWKGYGYPNWWLMRLAENGWRIKHVPVRAIYSGQRSGIKVSTFLPKVSLMLLIGLHSRIIRNTIKKPSIVLVITWATYLTGWLYHPVAFLIAHITDRMHVRNILRDTR
ncbi:MAG: glycosyltransferase family 2 protein [Euryarchaeota archaeon]|jgi:glycosyltransferase involved in cell wall biosynthesis|nr:glycosyltransferase family 2 protein [Euryarchaeota archaeon]